MSDSSQAERPFMPTTPQEIGIAIFSYTWLMLRDGFYEQSRLVDWPKRFAAIESISDVESGIARSRELIESVGDCFTRLTVKGPGEIVSAGLANDGPEAVQLWMMAQNIAYVAIADFKSEKTVSQLSNIVPLLAGANGVIFDFSFNPGGAVEHGVEALECVIGQGPIYSLESRNKSSLLRTDVSFDRDFVHSIKHGPNGVVHEKRPRRYRPLNPRLPCAIIVNPMTASCAEMAVLALHHNCNVVATAGEPSVGKGIAQGPFPYIGLPIDVTLDMTNGRWLGPDGRWLGDAGQTKGESVPIDLPLINPADGELIYAVWRRLCESQGLNWAGFMEQPRRVA